MINHKKTALHFAAFLGVLSACFTSPAHATNRQVEAALQTSGDVSMFYEALQNTGLLNQLRENQQYTIFAPTNEAWVQISQNTYPCFYAAQCRPQIAAYLSNYIVVGHADLKDLTRYGSGVQSMGARKLHVVEAYPGQYTVEGKRILTDNKEGGSTVYRLDSVISRPEELAVFKTVPAEPTTDSLITKQKMVSRTTVYTNSPETIAPNSEKAATETTVTYQYTIEPQ